MPDYQYSFYKQFIKNAPFNETFLYYKQVEEKVNQGNLTEALQLITSSDLIRKNFLILEVRMSYTQRVAQYTDVPAVTLENFIGSLGGILNLWVGLSFITIVEVVELLIKVARKMVVSTEVKIPNVNSLIVKEFKSFPTK